MIIFFIYKDFAAFQASIPWSVGIISLIIMVVCSLKMALRLITYWLSSSIFLNDKRPWISFQYVPFCVPICHILQCDSVPFAIRSVSGLFHDASWEALKALTMRVKFERQPLSDGPCKRSYSDYRLACIWRISLQAGQKSGRRRHRWRICGKGCGIGKATSRWPLVTTHGWLSLPYAQFNEAWWTWKWKSGMSCEEQDVPAFLFFAFSPVFHLFTFSPFHRLKFLPSVKPRKPYLCISKQHY